ncbi:hypothetical protein GCM10023189_16700 [Nibrella saemangeumensis]|uniref:DUF3575 domain-containing protein n=1 Tax=Nibrella saemangeumensis TaxID=1084526 RepID=A0ABP8MM41_9BACT
MKIYLLPLLLVCSGLAKGQTTPVITEQADSLADNSFALLKHRHNIVKINPLSLALVQVSVFYERALSPRLSVVVGYGQGSNTRDFGRQTELGGGTYRRGTLELRRYFSNQGLKGFYIGPYMRFLRITEFDYVYDQQRQVVKNSNGTVQTVYRHANVWVTGVLGGYQVHAGRFTVDTFLGLQHQSLVGTLRRGNQFVEALTAEGIVARFGLTCGFNF